jgi:hypothetical protein
MAESRRSDFYLIFLGVLLGFAASSLLSPRLIRWYAQPPYSLGFDCTPAIDWGLTQIVRWQVAGMFVCALGLWTLSVVVRKKRVPDL